MRTTKEMTMRAQVWGLGLVVIASSAACTNLEVKNKTPTTTIALTVPEGAMMTPCNFNMLPIATSCSYTPPGYPNRVVILPIFDGSPIDIRLTASGKDSDGTVK